MRIGDINQMRAQAKAQELATKVMQRQNPLGSDNPTLTRLAAGEKVKPPTIKIAQKPKQDRFQQAIAPPQRTLTQKLQEDPTTLEGRMAAWDRRHVGYETGGELPPELKAARDIAKYAMQRKMGQVNDAKVVPGMAGLAASAGMIGEASREKLMELVERHITGAVPFGIPRTVVETGLGLVNPVEQVAGMIGAGATVLDPDAELKDRLLSGAIVASPAIAHGISKGITKLRTPKGSPPVVEPIPTTDPIPVTPKQAAKPKADPPLPAEVPIPGATSPVEPPVPKKKGAGKGTPKVVVEAPKPKAVPKPAPKQPAATPKADAPAKGKEPWEMTREEFVAQAFDMPDKPRILIVVTPNGRVETTFEQALADRLITKKWFNANRWGGVTRKQDIQVNAWTKHHSEVWHAIKEGKPVPEFNLDRYEFRENGKLVSGRELAAKYNNPTNAPVSKITPGMVLEGMGGRHEVVGQKGYKWILKTLPDEKYKNGNTFEETAANIKRDFTQVVADLDTQIAAQTEKVKKGPRPLAGAGLGGFDPGHLADVVKLGALHVKKGLANFSKWSIEMVKNLGGWFKPYAKAVWEKVGAPVAKKIAATDAEKAARGPAAWHDPLVKRLGKLLADQDFKGGVYQRQLENKELRKRQAAALHSARSESGKAGLNADAEHRLMQSESKKAGVADREVLDLFKGNFSEDELSSLKGKIQSADNISEFDRRVAYDAYDGLIRGLPPAPHELKILEKVYGKEVAYRLSEMSASDKAFAIASLNRSTATSFDASWPGRQGVMALVSHPKAIPGTFKDMYEALRSHDGAARVQARLDQEVQRDPRLKKLVIGGGITGDTEDMFATNLVERAKAWAMYDKGMSESAANKVFGLVERHDEAYRTAGNSARVRIFKEIDSKWAKAGKPLTEEESEKMAKYILELSGRGGKIAGNTDFGKVVQASIFSEQMLTSRLKIAARHITAPGKAMFGDKVAKQATRDFAAYWATIGSLGAIAKLSGAEVDLDPRNADTNSDWGYVKYGNTRLDLLGGLRPLIRLAATVYSGKKNSREQSDKDKSVVEDAIHSFFDNKLSPTGTIVFESMTGNKRFPGPISGDKADRSVPNVAARIGDSFVPMILQDIWKVVEDKGTVGAAPFAAAAIHGVGVNTYTPKELKKKAASPKQTATKEASEIERLIGKYK